MNYPVSSAPVLACPSAHFRPRQHWINDPNGCVYIGGEWHLFFQHNPYGDDWGHMSWGHAVSRDLINWEERAVAIPEDDTFMIFSGSAVVDHQNTSGLGASDAPPIVALYTGAPRKPGEAQVQCLAYSLDKGSTWTKWSSNPVLDLGLANFRDPKVIWDAKRHQWVMAVALPEQRQVAFFGSTNLLDWTELSRFGPAGSSDGEWECPDLFPLNVDGDTSHGRWVLLISVGEGGPSGGSGVQYFVGDFDGREFAPDPESVDGLWVDLGPDFYAAQTWSNVPESDGRRICIAWKNNWSYATSEYRAPSGGVMTLPRELTLARTEDGPRLRQQPVRELWSSDSVHRAAPETESESAPIYLIGDSEADIKVNQYPAEGCTRTTVRFISGVTITLTEFPTPKRLSVSRTCPERADAFEFRTEVSQVSGKWVCIIDGSVMDVFLTDGASVCSISAY